MTQFPQQNGTVWNYPTVGSWCITGMPAGWEFVENFGLRRAVDGVSTVGCNIALAEDKLAAGETFQGYMARQKALIQDRFLTTQVAGPQPQAVSHAGEGCLMILRHQLHPELSMLTVQTYMNCGSWVGVVTLTVPEPWLAIIRPEHDAFVRALHVMQDQPLANAQPLAMAA